MKISDQTIRPVKFVGGSTQPLTYIKPEERPDNAYPPTTSIPTQAIPPRGTQDQILTKDEAQQMQVAAQQRKSETGISTAIQRAELNRLLDRTTSQALLVEQRNEKAQEIPKSAESTKGILQSVLPEYHFPSTPNDPDKSQNDPSVNVPTHLSDPWHGATWFTSDEED